MNITIIPEKCIACGLCQTYSDQFDYHDDGIVRFASDETALSQPLSPNDLATITAVKNCPTKALILE